MGVGTCAVSISEKMPELQLFKMSVSGGLLVASGMLIPGLGFRVPKP